MCPVSKRFPAISLFAVGALILLILALPRAASAEAAFLDAEDAFALTVEKPTPESDQINLHWRIAPGYYLYRARIGAVEQPSGKPSEMVLPAGDQKNDPNFGAVEVYHNAVTAQINSSHAKSLTITWQGCADAGLCYPPQNQTVSVKNDARDASTDASDARPSLMASLFSAGENSDSSIKRLLDQQALYWTLPLFVLLGIVLAFTPCVLPMIPIVSSIVIGQNVRPRRALSLSLAFVLPMALVYSSLGLGAAMAGANLQAALQNRWAILAFGALFVVLALPMFGFFTLQLPAFLRDRLDNASRQQQRGKHLGAAGMGVISALMVGPCMTAPLAGTLLYIAQSGDALKGALLLFAMGIGMGLPLIAISVAGARSLPKPGPWMARVKGGFGFMMLGIAIWMIQRVVPGAMVLVLSGMWLISLGLTLLQLTVGSQIQAAPGVRIAVRCVAALACLWGGASVLGAAAGATDPMQPLTFSVATGAVSASVATAELDTFTTVASGEALAKLLAASQSAGQPALVDFYADWCVSCKSIEKEVFSAVSVQQALAGTKLIRVDVTDNNASVRALMRRLDILGPPTVMLFDRNGIERRGARLVGEFNTDDLLQRLQVQEDRLSEATLAQRLHKISPSQPEIK